MSEKSIYKKLHAVMSEVSYIQKDKKNTFHGYTYASEQAIKEALHAALVKHGVLFMVDVVSSQNERIQGNKGESILTTAQFRYRFFDAETGECVEGTFQGTGIDNQDKALYKAITGAIKYILTSTFLIPTGDDPENDNGKKDEPKQKAENPNNMTVGQLKELQSLVEQPLSEKTKYWVERAIKEGATKTGAAKIISGAKKELSEVSKEESEVLDIESDPLENPEEVPF